MSGPTCFVGVRKREDAERIFEEIMDENSPDLTKDMNINQKLSKLIKVYLKRPTSRYNHTL